MGDHLTTIQKIAVITLPLMYAIIIHEIAHGWVAEKLGDPTARRMGRLTLNPLPHIDLFGTVLMPLAFFLFSGGKFAFGYAKPVPINPYNFRHPRRDMALSSLAGPGVNILMAISCTFLLRVVLPALEGKIPQQPWDLLVVPLALMLGFGVIINVVLAVLNLIPIPPLDGSRILYWLLPEKQAAAYYRLERYGLLIFIALFVLRVIDTIIWPVIVTVLYYLLGKDMLCYFLELFSR